MVNRERLIVLLEELCRVDSAPRQERLMADRIRAELEDLGFAVQEDGAAAAVGGNAGNLIARLPGTRPGAEPIMLSAHLDRVPGGIGVKPQRQADRVTSDGTTILGADDCAGLAAILEAVRTAREQGRALPPLEVVITVCEEVGLLGAKAVDVSRLQSRKGYVLDAEGPVGAMVIDAPSSARIIATFTGRAAHAGIAPEKGISAIQMAARAIDRMKLGRLDEETTANVGIIKGGVARNVVPELCEVQAEARSHSDAKLDAQLNHMAGALEAAAAEFGGRVAYNVERNYGGFRLDEGAPVVTHAVRAARSCGLRPELKKSGGGSDANVFNLRGIPTVALCTGYQKIHTFQEYMPIDELIRLAELTLALLSV